MSQNAQYYITVFHQISSINSEVRRSGLRGVVVSMPWVLWCTVFFCSWTACWFRRRILRNSFSGDASAVPCVASSLHIIWLNTEGMRHSPLNCCFRLSLITGQMAMCQYGVLEIGMLVMPRLNFASLCIR